ncbi:hypothetical protein AVEN_78335-1 [Araneus ventricosus]|uniref:Uncharacterized protein n=1 Tax=Araneus ventricosus TaxID=182803 RepID=A0A4Y2J2F4_ARAVE|nr:hypothetical protein AVEN_78335-1 [Araneus ventricosus]
MIIHDCSTPCIWLGGTQRHSSFQHINLGSSFSTIPRSGIPSTTSDCSLRPSPSPISSMNHALTVSPTFLHTHVHTPLGVDLWPDIPNGGNYIRIG